MADKQRCTWCNAKNPLYIRYHDEEWGILRTDDPYLYEMLILESFQAGLSWECVLNKRDAFRAAFDSFDPVTVADYGEEKIAELLANPAIIRNKLKIRASIENSKIFLAVTEEFGSLYAYLKRFSGEIIRFEQGKTTSALSDAISSDLKKRGMKYVGSTIIYSYLQAIGLISSHDPQCFLYQEGR